MGKGDIIFLLVIALLVGGFWYFNKSTQEKTFLHYQKCETLFEAAKYEEASECYEKALELNYRTDSLDALGYQRREQLDSILSVGK